MTTSKHARYAAMRLAQPKQAFSTTQRLWLAALVVWLLALTATPIAGWVGGESTFPAMATIGVIAQVAVTLIALASAWPLLRIARAVVVIAIGTWGVEALGTATGFPFGVYHYTDALQPQIAHVPLLIPLAWLMMLPPAWAVTAAILPGPAQTHAGTWRHRALFAALTGVAFTAWDLYLDPQMVTRGLWIWDQPGGYFGIPWINFAGWWATAALLTWIVHPRNLPRRPLLIVYTLVWLFQAVGLGVLWNQPGPALVGFAVMGLFTAWSWHKERQP